MSTTRSQSRKRARTERLEVLTDGRRRRILAVLDQTAPVSERELATLVAAMEDGTRPESVGDERVRAVEIDLQHVQLPALDDAEMVSWNRGDRTVTTVAGSVLPDGGVDPIADDWDDVFDCLASERRRIALDVLRDDGTLSHEDLARAVAARESSDQADEPATDGGRSSSDVVLSSLYHVHLPKLEDADLIEHGSETVTYRGHPDLPVADMLTVFDPGFR